ncbi:MULTISPECIES: hypothetical protein [unclassified Aeromicrobium]|uniref:hypothetical protein n=1 Tax=unclassified Aeromicrobium TaxID=2633570 RepID=UPI00396B155F
MADGSRLVPIAGIDRLLGGSIIHQTFSPLDLPSVEALRDAFVRLADHGPETRVGFERADADHWRYRGPAIADRVEEIVREVPQEAPESAQEWLLAHLVPDLPLQFAVKGDELAAVFDHVLFDAPLAAALPAVLVAMAGGAPVPALFDGVTDRPVSTALWHTFGRHPRRVLDLVRDRQDGPVTSGDVPREDDRVPLVDPGGLGLRRHRNCDAAQMAGVREWGAARGLGLSSTLLLLTSAAVEQAGIPVEPQGDLVVDLRRYLPEGVATGGNFITGVSVPVWSDGFEPRMLGERLDALLRSGRPLASVAIRLLRARRRPPQVPTAADTVARPVRARVSLSNPGRLRLYEQMPWTAPPAERRAVPGTEGIAPNAIGFISTSDAGRFRLAVSFRGDVFDAATVDAALDLIFTDPVAVLDAML